MQSIDREGNYLPSALVDQANAALSIIRDLSEQAEESSWIEYQAVVENLTILRREVRYQCPIDGVPFPEDTFANLGELTIALLDVVQMMKERVDSAESQGSPQLVDPDSVVDELEQLIASAEKLKKSIFEIDDELEKDQMISEAFRKEARQRSQGVKLGLNLFFFPSPGKERLI